MGGSRKRAGKGKAAFVLGAGPARRVCLAAGLLVVLCHFLLSPGLLALNVTYDAAGMSCVVAILFGVRRHRPALPAAWYLFCGGVALSVVGDGTWTVQEGFLGMEVSFPSVADAFCLGGYPFVAAGLLLFVRGRPWTSRATSARRPPLAFLALQLVSTSAFQLLSVRSSPRPRSAGAFWMGGSLCAGKKRALPSLLTC